MGSSFLLPRAQPPTDHRTPGPVLGHQGLRPTLEMASHLGGARERHSSKDQQAVGETLGACLT